MKFLVDAGIIFDFFSGKTELFSFFDDCEEKKNIYISPLTQGELFYRALSYKDKVIKIPVDNAAVANDCSKKNNTCIEDYPKEIIYEKTVAEVCSDFCEFLNIIPIDEKIAVKFGVLKNEHRDMSDFRLWLAATSIEKDFVLVTSDLEYKKIQNLVVNIM